jgi:hypothetical protein
MGGCGGRLRPAATPMPMRKDNHDLSYAEWEARVEAAYRRAQQGLPPVSWLPPHAKLNELRRQVRRLRAGELEPDTPRIPAAVWADMLEQAIAMRAAEIMEKRIKAHQESFKEGTKNYWTLYNGMYVFMMALKPGMDAKTLAEMEGRWSEAKRVLRKRRGRLRTWKKRRS